MQNASPELRVCDSGAAVALEVMNDLLRAPIRSSAGLGIGLYQAARHAEKNGYALALTENRDGSVCFALRRAGRGLRRVTCYYVQLLKMGGKDGSVMISTTRMFKPLLRGAILLLAFAAVGQAAAQPPPPPPTTLPTTTDQCLKGGWQTFKVFKNQGDCVSFVATKGKNPPAK